jgi:hypothetical protein
MRIGYVGLDEVNRELVQHWARFQKAEFVVLGVACDGGVEPLDLVVCDLDHLPKECRRCWLSNLQEGRQAVPILVQSYSLSDEQEKALRNRGVRVIRRRLVGSILSQWKRDIARLCRAKGIEPRTVGGKFRSAPDRPSAQSGDQAEPVLPDAPR